ncbi:unnamed protein product [Pedinophyceae sp. YPF-701]|nr:unnamed protein product [Pedinophyceae sp. YPF-701]
MSKYREAAAYLRSLGINNASEVARICDVAMNPNSMFVTFRDRKRNQNKSSRLLDVDQDIRPVVEYLRTLGLDEEEVCSVILEHPPVLCYSVEERLKPLVDFLAGIDIEDPGRVLVARPSLMGLDVDASLRRIVGYLEANDYTPQDIAEYLSKSI